MPSTVEKSIERLRNSSVIIERLWNINYIDKNNDNGEAEETEEDIRKKRAVYRNVLQPLGYEGNHTTFIEKFSPSAKKRESVQSKHIDFYEPLHEWPGLKIRIGMNSGICRITYDHKRKKYDYNGPTVYTTSRITRMCNAGQIVLCEYTYNCLDFEERHNYELIELGKQQFPALDSEVRLYQLSFLNGLLYEGLRFFHAQQSSSAMGEEPMMQVSYEEQLRIERLIEARNRSVGIGVGGGAGAAVFTNTQIHHGTKKMTLGQKIKSYLFFMNAKKGKNVDEEEPVVQQLPPNNMETLQRIKEYQAKFNNCESTTAPLNRIFKLCFSPFNVKERCDILERHCDAFCISIPLESECASEAEYYKVLYERVLHKLGELIIIMNTKHYKKQILFEEHTSSQDNTSSEDEEDEEKYETVYNNNNNNNISNEPIYDDSNSVITSTHTSPLEQPHHNEINDNNTIQQSEEEEESILQDEEEDVDNDNDKDDVVIRNVEIDYDKVVKVNTKHVKDKRETEQTLLPPTKKPIYRNGTPTVTGDDIRVCFSLDQDELFRIHNHDTTR